MSSKIKLCSARLLRNPSKGQATGWAPNIKRPVIRLLVFVTSRYTGKELSLESLISNMSLNVTEKLQNPGLEHYGQ